MKIETKRDWLTFEIGQWRDAINDRGLRLESLDYDERKLVAEANGPLKPTERSTLPTPFASPSASTDRSPPR